MFKALFFIIMMFLFIVCVKAQGKSQQVSMITIQNDTLVGEGYVARGNQYCEFKKLGDTHFQTYYPFTIAEFKVQDGSYYVSHKVKGIDGTQDWYFLEYLVDGAVDLYVISNPNRYFIKKDGQDFLELNSNLDKEIDVKGNVGYKKDNRYIGYMKVYMSDAPALFDEIEDMTHLSQRGLVKLSTDYHKTVCNDYECIVYKKRIPDIAYKLELFSGVNYHNSYYTPQLGLLLHVWMPLKNEKLFCKVGLLVKDRDYWLKEPYEVDEVKYIISIPLSFQYNFGKKSFKPTFSFGFPTGISTMSVQGGFIYSTKRKIEFTASASIDRVLILLSGSHPEFYNNPFGHSIYAGLIYKIN